MEKKRAPRGRPKKPAKDKKPKHHQGQQKTTVSLSFSVPIEVETPMNRQAAARGMNRSQYIAWLVQADIWRSQLPSESDGILPNIPPRIRRGRKEKGS